MTIPDPGSCGAALPLPDLGQLDPELAAAVERVGRLIQLVRTRYPDLDRFAVAPDSDIDRKAAFLLAAHLAAHNLDFGFIVCDFDPMRRTIPREKIDTGSR